MMKRRRMMMTFRIMKTLALVLVTCIGWHSASLAGVPESVASGLVIRVDWQVPESLPPRFRNHCAYENFTGRPYCSDHCGVDYQFYYCSEASFGCCHLGHGYCDFNGLVRCHP
jgi:hypothetical protein